MKQGRSKPGPRSAQREVDLAALTEILGRVKEACGQEDYETLQAAVDTLAFLTQELGAKGATISRLRNIIFGAATEKSSRILPKQPEGDQGGEPAGESPGEHADPADGAAGSPKKKRPGHGRNGAASFRGAEHIEVPHPTLKRGDRCPECSEGHQGKIYPIAKPAQLLRVTGVAPISAKVYELGRLRCNLCGEVFVAEPPPGVGPQKFDETATAMIGLLKYGAGLPFYRIAKLEGSLGIPLPSATQWELVADASDSLAPTYGELVRQAAQGEVLHNDDTTMKILNLDRDSLADEAGMGGKRTGVFTTGILSTREGHRIALFFTGTKHAGENLAEVLRVREADLPPPIQMCDALSRNLPKDFKTILGNCLVHGRRQFVEIADSFPAECRYVIEILRDVYKHDAEAKEQNLTAEERLAMHQAKSGPLMTALEQWLRAQVEEKRVEPNSELGKAIAYMRKHWEALTLFLREPGAPLDNNRCEQALKRAVLHRKNSYFYKTENGARVGDIYMSLIHTAELAGVNPFDYMVALLRNAEHVADDPAQWLPWNYQEAAAQHQGPAP